MTKIKALEASMNRRNRIFFALALIGALMISSCNSSSDEVSYEADTQNLGGVAIKGFSLRKNAAVLNNLDSVFFSIDLNNARIFNATPLPYGTDVSALGVSITSDECQSLTIFSPDEENGEKEINYLDDDAAKIDFSKGEVKLKIVSYDGEHSRDYVIQVNVNTVVPDSLFWSEMACRELPGSMAQPKTQKTVKAGDKVYTLIASGNDYEMCVSENPYDWRWSGQTVVFPKKVDVRTLTATATSLYILAEDGQLLTSTDGSDWSATGEVWTSIIAPWNDTTVLGLKQGAGGGYVHVTYPATTEIVASNDFPVSGNSEAVAFSTKWAVNPQVVTMGGRKADGTLTGATWAYDGTSWARISESMPAAEGYAVTKYTICETDTMSWRMKVSDVMIAFGGRGKAGTLGRDVYISRDMGITWTKGGVSLQLPKYMPSVYDADLVVYPVEMHADASAAAASWLEMPVAGVDPYYARIMPKSRIISSTESWECPYLYMFGGVGDDGTLQNKVWRGVINHFTFRPIE